MQAVEHPTVAQTRVRRDDNTVLVLLDCWSEGSTDRMGSWIMGRLGATGLVTGAETGNHVWKTGPGTWRAMAQLWPIVRQ